MAKRPTHKKCRYCKEWFSFSKRAPLKQKFCSVGCWAKYRTADPKWRAEQSRLVKAKTDPKVMRERAEAMWRDPEMRAHLSEKVRQRTNGKEHQARMVEHNKKIWADPEFRQRHVERSRKTAAKKWTDPAYREKMSAAAIAGNKKRWADPEFKGRTSFRIRVAKADPLRRKHQSKISRERAQQPGEKARLSQMMKERWEDPEQRARMSKRSSETAKKKWTDPVYRKKKIAPLLAWARSEEGRKNAAALGKKLTTDSEYIARRKAWWEAEGKAAQIEGNKKRWADPEYKARVSKAISEAKRKPKSRALTGELSKKRWADPEFKAHISKKVSEARRKVLAEQKIDS